jgi:hypothetical protein
MNYNLKVTETNNKAAKYFYEIQDEAGNTLVDRKSNREYVAATIDGRFFFGRIDLIGKGDHGRQIKWQQKESREITPIAYKK